MTEVCEHGHQARKCEVCELTDEIVRLREAVRVLAEGRVRLMDAVNGEAYGDKASSMKCIQLRTAEYAAHKAIENNPIAAEAVRKAGG